MDRSARARRSAAVGAVLLAIALWAPGAAIAQMGEDLAPDLDGLGSTPLPTTSPLPSLDTGVINDALDDADAPPDPDGDTGGGNDDDEKSGDGASSGGGGNDDERSRPGGGRSDARADPPPGSNVGSDGTAGAPDAPGTTTSSVRIERDDPASGSSLGSGAVIAAGRALRLAGPLAPPLAVAAIALGVLVALGRGPERLLKVERDERHRRRRMRL